MSEYAIIVTRHGGELQPVATDDGTLETTLRKAMRFAEKAAVHGCPMGDAEPPRWVDVRHANGDLILRIVVDASLKPASVDAP